VFHSSHYSSNLLILHTSGIHLQTDALSGSLHSKRNDVISRVSGSESVPLGMGGVNGGLHRSLLLALCQCVRYGQVKSSRGATRRCFHTKNVDVKSTHFAMLKRTIFRRIFRPVDFVEKQLSLGFGRHLLLQFKGPIFEHPGVVAQSRAQI